MGDLAEELTAAELLQDRLTEFGLVRVLSRQDVSPSDREEIAAGGSGTASSTKLRAIAGA
jgi:hypothetical protein